MHIAQVVTIRPYYHIYTQNISVDWSNIIQTIYCNPKYVNRAIDRNSNYTFGCNYILYCRELNAWQHLKWSVIKTSVVMASQNLHCYEIMLTLNDQKRHCVYFDNMECILNVYIWTNRWEAMLWFLVSNRMYWIINEQGKKRKQNKNMQTMLINLT